MRLRAEGRKVLKKARDLISGIGASVVAVPPRSPQEHFHQAPQGNDVGGPLALALSCVLVLAVVSFVRCKLVGGTRPE
jgi:hypothetical protein